MQLRRAAPKEHRDRQEMVKRALGKATRIIRSSPAADGRIDKLVYDLSPEGDDIPQGDYVWVNGG